MSRATLLKKEQPFTAIYLRIYGEEQARLTRLAGGRRGGHNAIALAGLRAEMERLETLAPGVTLLEAQALASARAAGVDPVAALLAATEASLLAEAPSGRN